MDGYSLLVFILFSVGCVAVPTEVTLTGPATVTEGTDPAITFICTLDEPAVVQRSFPLVYVPATSTSENGFDHGNIASDTTVCVVNVGAKVGTVSVPLIDDVVIDAPAAGESLVVRFATTGGLSDMTAGGMITISIMDDGVDNVPLRITARELIVKAKELTTATPESTATITLDFIDANGNLAPIEETITISATTVTEVYRTTTTDSGDFTDPGTLTISYTTGAAETSSTQLVYVILNDPHREGLEHLTFMLGDDTIAPEGTITAVGTPYYQLQIADDDLPQFIALQDMTPLSRRSKKDSTIWAVSNEGGGGLDVEVSTLGQNLRDCKQKFRTVNSMNALEVTVPRPNRNSKARYNEFKFNRGDTLVLPDIVYSYLTPTSHTEKAAPIETGADSLLYVYPDAQVCTALEQTYCISVPCTKVARRELQWSFIPQGGFNKHQKSLKKYNGKDSIRISECGMDGLYIVSRRGRAKTGWLDFVRVLQAACPSNAQNFGGANALVCFNAPTAASCMNQGVFNQKYSTCICPPGFAGFFCELEQDPGTFGANCEFKVEDYFKGNSKGKCIKFSLPTSVTCAAGFTGNDCCDECKEGWNFGANCAQTCHCVDSMCDPFSGRCANGCAPGYKEFNCQ